MKIITGIILFLQIILLIKIVQTEKVLREIKILLEEEMAFLEEEEEDSVYCTEENTKSLPEKTVSLREIEKEKLLDDVLSQVFSG